MPGLENIFVVIHDNRIARHLQDDQFTSRHKKVKPSVKEIARLKLANFLAIKKDLQRSIFRLKMGPEPGGRLGMV